MAGICSATSLATSGPPDEAVRAAVPCTQAASDPASEASRPAASKVPPTPESTSPAPAVASSAGPVADRPHRPSRTGHQRRRSLEQDGDSEERGRRADVLEATSLDVGAVDGQQPGQLTRVGGEQGRRRVAARQQGPVAHRPGEGVGVQQDRQPGREEVRAGATP